MIGTLIEQLGWFGKLVVSKPATNLRCKKKKNASKQVISSARDKKRQEASLVRLNMFTPTGIVVQLQNQNIPYFICTQTSSYVVGT